MVGHGGVDGRVVHTRNRHTKVIATNGILTADVSGVTGITRFRFRTTHLLHSQIQTNKVAVLLGGHAN
ncbi:hypothetical protein DX888_09510 [Vibrio alginolyticus]|nr:hypothetical protein [Vibrio alginolyticus]EGR2550884.1 hypothetical protein [Vibrio alginolyticus]